MATISRITPCLWFDGRAEEAANFYTGIFPNSQITSASRYTESGREVHQMEPGSVLTISFELDGHPFTALNGPPIFKFTEAISMMVNCDTQDEIDHYWERLREGGDEAAQQCGWLKDKFGMSWQVVPRMMGELMSSGECGRSERVMAALMQMKKLDIAGLRRAYEG